MYILVYRLVYVSPWLSDCHARTPNLPTKIIPTKLLRFVDSKLQRNSLWA